MNKQEMFSAITKAKRVKSCVRSYDGYIIGFCILSKDSAKKLVMEVKDKDLESLRFDVDGDWLWIG